MSNYPVPRIGTTHAPRYKLFLLTLTDNADEEVRDSILQGEEYDFEKHHPMFVAAQEERMAYAQGRTYREIIAKYPDLKRQWDKLADARRNWRNLR